MPPPPAPLASVCLRFRSAYYILSDVVVFRMNLEHDNILELQKSAKENINKHAFSNN